MGTPIGNLEDITLRALYTLKKADKIICEDTRVTGKLLKAYGIQKPTIAFHEHSSSKVLDSILNDLQKGLLLAFVSDAGMPLISDPGFDLVKLCQAHEIYYTTIPGPTAFVSALVLSGFPSHHFNFLGYFREKTKERKGIMDLQQDFPGTSIFYETPHRLLKTLQYLEENYGDMDICVAREITKRFETVHKGTPQSLKLHFEENPPKGEMVLLMAPSPSKAINFEEDLKKALLVMGVKDAVQHIAELYPVPKKTIYQKALELKK